MSEMLDDTMESIDEGEDEELGEEAEKEVEKILYDITNGKLGQLESGGGRLPVGAAELTKDGVLLNTPRFHRRKRKKRRKRKIRKSCGGSSMPSCRVENRHALTVATPLCLAPIHMYQPSSLRLYDSLYCQVSSRRFVIQMLLYASCCSNTGIQLSTGPMLLLSLGT